MQGMPRRVAVYDPQFRDLNMLSSFAAFVLGISTFILLYNLIQSIRSGKLAGANPWRALTLEWQTTSPPPPYNFLGNPIAFEDPYGYGTEASKAYLDEMASRLEPLAPPEPAPEGDESAAEAPAAEE